MTIGKSVFHDDHLAIAKIDSESVDLFSQKSSSSEFDDFLFPSGKWWLVFNVSIVCNLAMVSTEEEVKKTPYLGFSQHIVSKLCYFCCFLMESFQLSLK